MMFAGCYTANSKNGYRLPSVAVSKGVDSAMGWSHEIWFNGWIEEWSTIFFTQAAARTNILDSANIAQEVVRMKLGEYGGTDQSVTYGNYRLSLYPAAYGN